jgi:hypothetical protein
VTGAPIGAVGLDLTEALDPRTIVRTRVTQGGAEPSVVRAMAGGAVAAGGAAAERAGARRAAFDAAEAALVAAAEELRAR